MSLQRAGLAVRPFIQALENRKLLAAGQLDPSFGSGGKETLNFNGVIVSATAVAVQGDGKTIVVGNAKDSPSFNPDIAIVRLNIDGKPDTTFGPNHNGIVRINAGGHAHESQAFALTIDGDGRILVAGDANGT